MIRFYLVVIFGLLSSVGNAVEVAFFTFRKPDGTVLELEPRGKFAHVAIRVGSQWMHAHPYRGVDFVDRLSQIGHEWTVLANDNVQPLSLMNVARFTKLKYDSRFRWEAEDSTYCSKLVGQILKIDPLPAAFEVQAWDHLRTEQREGSLGLSPDDLFTILKKRGFKDESPRTCEGLFR